MNSETALITGASSGIGLALAHEFARNGHRLILAAPSQEELRSIASDITREHDVDVGVVSANFEQPEGPAQICDAVLRDGAEVDILVNNAGLGFHGNFWNIPVEDHLSIIRVNIEAVTRMTHLFLPEMIARNRGRLVNIASIAGFEPGPLLAVYHASKAFVLSLTEALATELESTAITVTAICPGPTDTDFFMKAGMADTRAFQKAPVMAPQEVARISYRGIMRGDRTVVTGVSNKALVFARRFLTEGGQARLNKRFYEKAKPTRRMRKRGDIERRAGEKQLAE